MFTPGWFATTLGKPVTQVRAEPIGSGKMGRCIRFHLTYQDGSRHSVVGKLAATDERSRRTGWDSGSYQRELSFYQHLAAELSDWVPRCHHLHTDGEEFVLLLDDVVAIRQADPAEAVVELARLQARFWGITDNDWLTVRDGRRMAAIYGVLIGRFVERFGDRLSADCLGALEQFTPLVRRWLATDSPPFTLLHGDFRFDNLVFGERLAIVDWQTVAIGPGASDAAYLIGGSVPEESHELLRIYGDSLRANDIGMAQSECERSYRINTLAGLHMTVVGSMLVGQDAEGDAMFVEMAEKHTAHVAQWDPFALLA